MADERFLVVGLGNPGPRYASTRHNAGFLVLDVLADRMGGRFKTHRSNAEVLEGRLAGASVVLGKPRSFMNESGAPVVNLARFFKIAPERVVVVHDELDIPFGTRKLKRGGGDGGHNGLKSITASLGSKEYLRVRFGIGRPPGRQDPADYVLKDFAATERKNLGVEVELAADAIELLVREGLEAAQNQVHAEPAR